MDESILSTKHMRKTNERVIIGFKIYFCFEELKPWKRRVTYCCMLGSRIQKLYLFCSQSVVPMCRIQLLFKCATKQQSAHVDQRRNENEEERKKRETASEKGKTGKISFIIFILFNPNEFNPLKASGSYTFNLL
jgi:hypothetical protein